MCRTYLNRESHIHSNAEVGAELARKTFLVRGTCSRVLPQGDRYIIDTYCRFASSSEGFYSIRRN
jgi:hypothetical protein